MGWKLVVTMRFSAGYSGMQHENNAVSGQVGTVRHEETRGIDISTKWENTHEIGE